MKLKYLIVTALLILPFTVQAEKANFVVKFNDQDFEFSSDQIQQASGQYTLPKNSNLVLIPKNNAELLAEFFNQATDLPQLDSFSYDPKSIYNFISSIAGIIEKKPTEPELTISGNRALNFIPPSDGISVNIASNSLLMLNQLQNKQVYMTLEFSSSSPKTLLANTNNLGINELIAHGVSNFKGSPKNRRHNIKVGVEKFTGLIIQKGEEFSFNKYLGPVEEDQGFLPELVIKASGTVPELGGGLCQVSSTTFRAAMEAGLPILQRKNHAYAVQYYSPQGTDATIYPGVVDLKFKNDTPGAILVWPHFEENDNLIFDFYGTKDSRVVTLEKPKAYDRKPDGSLKAEWTRIIEKDGVTSSSTFKSIYLSPALFHKEEKFITTPEPTPSPQPTTN